MTKNKVIGPNALGMYDYDPVLVRVEIDVKNGTILIDMYDLLNLQEEYGDLQNYTKEEIKQRLMVLNL